jgi:hypothetical protein
VLIEVEAVIAGAVTAVVPWTVDPCTVPLAVTVVALTVVALTVVILPIGVVNDVVGFIVEEVILSTAVMSLPAEIELDAITLAA